MSLVEERLTARTESHIDAEIGTGAESSHLDPVDLSNESSGRACWRRKTSPTWGVRDDGKGVERAWRSDVRGGTDVAIEGLSQCRRLPAKSSPHPRFRAPVKSTREGVFPPLLFASSVRIVRCL